MPEYCEKCLQVGHKCGNEGTRSSAPVKTVTIWIRKPEGTKEADKNQGAKDLNETLYKEIWQKPKVLAKL